MKRRQWIVYGLAILVAGIGGQMTALGLDAEYDTAEVTVLKVSGAHPATSPTTGTITFNSSDGTFDLVTSDNDFTGTYTVAKNGKQVAFALDESGTSELEIVIISGIQDIAEGEGITLSNLTLSDVKVKITNATVNKSGNPEKTTITVTGKATAGADGRSVTRSFSYKSVVVFS